MFCNKFHAVTKQSQMHPNTTKMHWNIGIGSNGVDWLRSLPKIPTWLRGTNFNCTSSPRFAPSFMQLQNDPKCIHTLWNSPKHEFRVQWAGPGAFVAKMTDTTSWHELFSLIGAVQPKLHRVSYNIETIPNAPKHYETNQKKSLLSNGLDQARSF